MTILILVAPQTLLVFISLGGVQFSGQPVVYNLSIHEPGQFVTGMPHRPDMYLLSRGISKATSGAGSGIFSLFNPPLQHLNLEITKQLFIMENVFN